MTVTHAPESRILTSASFRRARVLARQTVNTPEAMADLIRACNSTSLARRDLRDGSPALDLDIICAVVEARIEELEAEKEIEGPLRLSVTADARLRLAVAALHYLVDPYDVIPDHHAGGLIDDIVVLRWASRMVREVLPV